MRRGSTLRSAVAAAALLAAGVAACADGLTDPADAALSAGGDGDANQTPLAAAGGPYTGTPGVALVFDGSGSSDPDGPASGLTYVWTFGDGTGGAGAVPPHAFTSPGTYRVTLVVKDRAGAMSAPATTTATITASSSAPAVLVGAGDIAVCGSRNDDATAALLDAIPGTVFVAGDNAYDDGTLSQYRDCYDPSWGRHRSRTRPTAGNHEYNTSGAAGYYSYFGAAAGERGKGYYSYDLGAWHIVVLNSSIARGATSAQVQWLRADLAAHPTACTLAYWHHPRFSSSKHGNDTSVQAFWDVLYAAGAELVVVGHDHTYERFAPQTPQGVADAARGIRQFVVGTGGAGHYAIGKVRANSEVRSTGAFGVIRFELSEGEYAWDFVPVEGATFRDSGRGACH